MGDVRQFFQKLSDKAAGSGYILEALYFNEDNDGYMGLFKLSLEGYSQEFMMVYQDEDREDGLEIPGDELTVYVNGKAMKKFKATATATVVLKWILSL